MYVYISFVTNELAINMIVKMMRIYSYAQITAISTFHSGIHRKL